jgi:hypothetical protein
MRVLMKDRVSFDTRLMFAVRERSELAAEIDCAGAGLLGLWEHSLPAVGALRLRG